jgi:hypothetical protein
MATGCGSLMGRRRLPNGGMTGSQKTTCSGYEKSAI